MTIESQPSAGEILGTRSPILYLVSDPNNANNDFRYIFELFVWTGAIGTPGSRKYEVRRQPRGDGKCVFDASTLIEEYIQSVRPNTVDTVDDIPIETVENGQVYFKVDVSAEWTGGSVAAVSSSTCKGTLGYSNPSDGVNFSTAPGAWLTSASKLFVPTSGPVLATFAMVDAPVGSIETRYYQGGVLVHTEAWGPYTNNNSTSSLATFNVGNPASVDRSQPYEVRIFNASLGGEVTLQIEPLCSVEDVYSLAFLNKLGGVETIGMTGKNSVRLQVTRSTFMSRALKSDLTADFDIGQFRDYNTSSKEVFTLNTGLLNEEANETIYQLAQSDAVWIRIGSNYFRVRNTNPEVIYKTSVNDQARYQWALSFELAFDNINSIR